MLYPLYKTLNGNAIVCDSIQYMELIPNDSVDLVITSPPFALQRQKQYGNKSQSDYEDWLLEFTLAIKRIIKDSGSFVLDLGGSYQKNKPIRSLYNFKLLIRMVEEQGWQLAEEFFWYNPAKLPSPIEWVNKRKIRVKDAVNTVWWMAKSDSPKANVKNVLVPYSERMKKLMEDRKSFYTPKKRPSGHDISDGFGSDNGGAIPSNLLKISNTDSNSNYMRLCKLLNLSSHPARFPSKLPEFFIKFLTDPGDIVVDIFAGSNTTGWVAEQLNRQWQSIELNHSYLAQSSLRFLAEFSQKEVKEIYSSLIANPEANYEIIPNSLNLLALNNI